MKPTKLAYELSDKEESLWDIILDEHFNFVSNYEEIFKAYLSSEISCIEYDNYIHLKSPPMIPIDKYSLMIFDRILSINPTNKKIKLSKISHKVYDEYLYIEYKISYTDLLDYKKSRNHCVVIRFGYI